MSRIIVEKELNNKSQQSHPQANFVNVFYDVNPNNNNNPTVNASVPVKTNEFLNHTPTNQVPVQDELPHQQNNTSNLNSSQQPVLLTPIIQITPYMPIPPLLEQKNPEPKPNFQTPNIYNASYNILGDEMSAQEVDDLFGNAEKLVGWSYWKINE